MEIYNNTNNICTLHDEWEGIKTRKIYSYLKREKNHKYYQCNKNYKLSIITAKWDKNVINKIRYNHWILLVLKPL